VFREPALQILDFIIELHHHDIRGFLNAIRGFFGSLVALNGVENGRVDIYTD